MFLQAAIAVEFVGLFVNIAEIAFLILLGFLLRGEHAVL